MRIRLGCLSEDRRYMMRLTNFFMARYPGQIEASVFTRQQELMSFFEDGGRMDVLLAQPDMLTSPQSLPGRVILAYLVEEPDVTGWNGRPAVCKYQKAQQLFRAVQGLAAEQDAQGRQYGRQRQAQMVLFMGAAGGVGCTTAAIGFAARMASSLRSILL